MTPNGKILSGIVERHNLKVLNGSKKCSGTVTRKRVTKSNVEESVIDIILVTSDIEDDLVSLVIDEGSRFKVYIFRFKSSTKLSRRRSYIFK